MPEVLKLEKPITVHADGTGGPTKEITELTMKEPGGKLLLYKGWPFSDVIEQGKDGTIRVEHKIIPALAREYLAEMTGVNEILLGQLTALDVRRAYNIMTRMLHPTEA